MLVSAAQSARCSPALRFQLMRETVTESKKNCNSTRLRPCFLRTLSSTLSISYLKASPCVSLNLFKWFNYLVDGLYKLNKPDKPYGNRRRRFESIDQGYSARRMTVCVPTL